MGSIDDGLGQPKNYNTNPLVLQELGDITEGVRM